MLRWMIKQKTDESIEQIDREKLFEYIDDQDFLAVVWCKLLKKNINYEKTWVTIYTSNV